MKQSGFGLLQLLVYCALFFMLASILFKGITIATIGISQVLQDQELTMDYCTIIHVLIKDGRSFDKLIKKDEGKFIFSDNAGKSIGWQLQDRSLYRLSGNYDMASNGWKKVTRALFAKDVELFVPAFDSLRNNLRISFKVMGIEKRDLFIKIV